MEGASVGFAVTEEGSRVCLSDMHSDPSALEV